MSAQYRFFFGRSMVGCLSLTGAANFSATSEGREILHACMVGKFFQKKIKKSGILTPIPCSFSQKFLRDLICSPEAHTHSFSRSPINTPLQLSLNEPIRSFPPPAFHPHVRAQRAQYTRRKKYLYSRMLGTYQPPCCLSARPPLKLLLEVVGSPKSLAFACRGQPS